ncbi:MAG: hypothetical protein WBZ36_16870, partial [Candidatus Nitrosopolaris sp.]
MPAKLTTTINKICSVPNTTNSAIIRQFSEYMRTNGSSEHHQNNNLKAVIAFAKFIGPHSTFYQIQTNDEIIRFLDTKINTEDNEKKWITTWNNYLTRIKLFFRWLYNVRGKNSDEIAPQSVWETPSFARIKGKKSKRASPYSETELWERDEILLIVRYEAHKRNKAMWTMMKTLRNRIVRLLESGSITNDEERQKLEYLLQTKKWNPYCIRHS